MFGTWAWAFWIMIGYLLFFVFLAERSDRTITPRENRRSTTSNQHRAA